MKIVNNAPIVQEEYGVTLKITLKAFFVNVMMVSQGKGLRSLFDLQVQPVHKGAFSQFPFWWIYYFGSNKSTRKETGKTHLCVI